MSFEGRGIEFFVLVLKRLFDSLCNTWRGEHPHQGGFWLIIVFGDLAPPADLGKTLGHGKEEVGVEAQQGIELVVVLAGGTGAGEGDLLPVTVAYQLVVDEFSSVIGIDAQKGKGGDVGGYL
ncbi:MAG TPA: hypothetical protein VLH40_08795 [Atribacteraceae bacterium]|nr:hypothetical protein [Atribacteraceae bacterium]